MMARLESKLAQTHVALTGPTRQQVLQLMMTRKELIGIAITGSYEPVILEEIATTG